MGPGKPFNGDPKFSQFGKTPPWLGGESGKKPKTGEKETRVKHAGLQNVENEGNGEGRKEGKEGGGWRADWGTLKCLKFGDFLKH